MTRIVLDPEQLAGAASDLSGAAGEYEAIGGQVAACNCGCMPASVAATVDATTAEIRRRLGYLASGLAEESGELAWRSGVPQAGGGVAISAASGPGVVGVGGGTMLLSGGDAGAGAATVTIGGDPFGWFSQPATGGYNLVVGGDSEGWFSEPATGGYNLVIGGDSTFLQPGIGGYSLTITGEPLYRPGEEEALRLAAERAMPLDQFVPRGIGVNVNPPFMPNLLLMGDVMSAMSYNPMLDPRGGTPSYYNYSTHERVFYR
jgi:hypothetical protein